jgi:hypothetical protein
MHGAALDGCEHTTKSSMPGSLCCAWEATHQLGVVGRSNLLLLFCDMK